MNEKVEQLSTVVVDPLVSELLDTFARRHLYCEDCWYTCPKHPEGCCNDAEGNECTCGADKHNNALQKFAEKLQARLSR